MGIYKKKLSRGERFYFRGQYLSVLYNSRAIYLTKQEAGKAERVKLKEIDEEARCPSNDMTLKSLMEERLDYIKVRMAVGYYKNNHRGFRDLLAYCGDIMASQVTKRHINGFLMAQSEKASKAGRGNMQINAHIRHFKALFNYGIDILELSIKNPCHKLKFYPIDIKLKHIPSDEEINAVRAILSQKQLLLLDFVYETACRVNEAVRLEAKDVANDHVVLYTRKAKNSNLTPRIIPRPDCLKGDFVGKIFKDWNSYPRFLDNIAEGWGWHNLRHKRASIWANNGMPIFEIMSRLGHNNMPTTMRYLQLLGYTKT